MTASNQRNILGVLGGLGPLASAEFLKTIYEENLGEHEQESPMVVLYSDPGFPKRTESFLRGDTDVLLLRLLKALDHLRNLGASRIVICCVTIHYLLPRLPAAFRKRIIPLPDVIFDAVLEKRKRTLLVCTNGTRKLELFQRHRRWAEAQDYIVLPDEDEQERLHDLTEEIKRKRGIPEMISYMDSLLAKYRIASFISGCTEVHLIAKQFLASNGNHKAHDCIDPLVIIAKKLRRNTL